MTVEEHTKSDKSDQEHAKEIISTILESEARGKDNRISSEDLARYTPVSASTVRDLIPEVRREYGLPIGSANGYFVIEDPEEATRQIERQRQQAETSRQTARDIAAAWNGRDDKDMDTDDDLRTDGGRGGRR